MNRNGDQNGSARGGDHDQEVDLRDRLFAYYVERLNSGESIDPERIRADHPEMATDLIKDLEVFQRVAVESDAPAPLGTLGDYTLRRQIGRGGMGVVYEAWENSMDRAVALKVLPVGVAADDRSLHRFVREAKTAGRLNHPNVVSVYGMGLKEQTPYYAMEYVEGETLARILARIKDTEPDKDTPFGKKDQVGYFAALANAFTDVSDGLQHAHSKGVVHRDIKPSNLILDGEGKLRILDFGLARLEGQESLTLSGDLLGTVLYMSPEQAMAKRIPLDHRTDVYSLGATIYEVLTGQPPFKGKDQHDTLSQIIVRDAPPPRRMNQRIPTDLETIVLKCLRKDPGERYGTAEALSQDLRRFVRGDAIEARPEGRWAAWRRVIWRSRGRLAGGFVLLLLVAAVLTVAAVWRARHEADLEREYTNDVEKALALLELGRVFETHGSKMLEKRLEVISGMVEDLDGPAGGAFSPYVQSAFDLFDRAQKRRPGRPDVPYHQARALALLGRLEEAREGFRRALDCDPGFTMARVLLAEVLDRLGRPELAQEERDEATASSERDWTTAWVEARGKTAARSWEAAEAAWGAVLEAVDPVSRPGVEYEARIGRAVSRLSRRWFNAAERDLIAALVRRPYALVPAMLLTHSYALASGEGRAAQKASSESDEFLEEFYRDFSVAYPDLAQDAAAIFAIDWSGAGDHDFWLSRMRQGPLRRRIEVAWAKHGYEDVVSLIESLDSMDRSDPVVLSSVAWRASSFPQLAGEARAMIDRACELGKGVFRVHWRAIHTYHKLDDGENCLEQAKLAYDLRPDLGTTWSDLGAAHSMYGDRDLALRIWSECLKLGSGNAWCYRNRAMALRQRGNQEGAEEDLDEAIRIFAEEGFDGEGHALALQLRARWRREENRLAEAIDDLEKAREVKPPLPHLHFIARQLAEYLIEAGNVEQALEVLVEELEARGHNSLVETNTEETRRALRLVSGILRDHETDDLRLVNVDALVEALEAIDPLSDELTAARSEALALVLLRTSSHRGDRDSRSRSRELAEAAFSLEGWVDPAFGRTLALVRFEDGDIAGAVKALEVHESPPGMNASDEVARYRKTLSPRFASADSVDTWVAESLAGQDTGNAGALQDARERVVEFEHAADGTESSLVAYARGRLHEIAGEHDEAVGAFEDAIRVGPPVLAAVSRLEGLLRRTSEYERLESLFREALTRSSNGAEVLWRGWLAVSFGPLTRSPEEILARFPQGELAASAIGAQARALVLALKDGTPLRIDCGRADDSVAGREALEGWVSDELFLIDGRWTRAYAATGKTSQEPYGTLREFGGAGEVVYAYRLPVPAGEYRIELHFIETRFRREGKRRFDVLIQGEAIEAGFEPIRDGFDTPAVLSRSLRVNDDGALDISFRRKVHRPTISGIEVAALR